MTQAQQKSVSPQHSQSKKEVSHWQRIQMICHFFLKYLGALSDHHYFLGKKVRHMEAHPWREISEAELKVAHNICACPLEIGCLGPYSVAGEAWNYRPCLDTHMSFCHFIEEENGFNVDPYFMPHLGME